MRVLSLLFVASVASAGGLEDGFFVKLKPNFEGKVELSEAVESTLLQDQEISEVRKFDLVKGLILVKTQKGVDTLKKMEKIASLAEAEYVVPNYRRTLQGFGPRDVRIAGEAFPTPKEKPAPPTEWKDDPKRSINYATYMSGAMKVWKTHSMGSPDVIIADIDTGVDYNHKDLAANMWWNKGETGTDENGADRRSNGVDDDGNGYVDDYIGWDFAGKQNLPYDDHGHGTHTSGIAAAVGGDGFGIAGVCPRCSIMALKFITAEGSGTDADAISSIEYAVKNGAKILNCSWGGVEYSAPLFDAFKAADAAGVISVTAAGNEGKDINQHGFYPARYNLPNQLTVSALYPVHQFIPFWSNYGSLKSHVTQAGAEIGSTIPGDKYASWSGTSMAAPGIAGSIGLIWSYLPSLTPAEIKQLVKKNIMGEKSGGKTAFHGRPNVEAIIKKLAQNR